MYTSDFDEKHDSDIDEMSHFLLLLKAFFMNSFFDIFFDTFFDTFFRQFEKPLKKGLLQSSSLGIWSNSRYCGEVKI